VALTPIVGIELVRRDRDSFDEWWPQHLSELAQLVDRAYFRVDPGSRGVITTTGFTLEDMLAMSPLKDWEIASQDIEQFGRFQEDHERQQLLAWAHDQAGVEWAVCFDADEVLEPGGGAALRQLLLHKQLRQSRLVRVILSYSSHHRPGYVLPRGGFKPWRAFRLDKRTRGYRYRSDADGLHCGSVPQPGVGSITVPDLRVIHYHATTCAEYMAERAFYDQTVEVHNHGGIDLLYRCDRFGDEAEAVPLEQELSGAAERLARVAVAKGLSR
jgi:hypothetical protein